MADVLIKGMEMPSNCSKCRFYDSCTALAEFEDYESILFNEEIGEEGNRHHDCPLVELPPHGDLIAKSNVLFNLQAEALGIDPNDNDFDGIKKGLLLARIAVLDAPTVLEASNG